MAAKFFTGLPLDGPDPECVRGFGAEALKEADPSSAPRPALDHSHRGPVRGQAVPVTIGRRPPGAAAATAPAAILQAPPARTCDENPLAGLAMTVAAGSTQY
jgi:[mycofactocin precursor peptide]-tyrosine decarboxylase / 3-amino-5-[(4-hydroxyphenyl)methyl]-4,4-dimethylpyrrolidin-2-one synthase